MVSARNRRPHPAAPQTDAAAAGRGGTALIPVSFGELIDKIVILEIKAARIADTKKLANVRSELALLRGARAGVSVSEDVIGPLKAELRQINETLWDVEDRLRDCERERNFGPEFIELARAVYRTNDRRSAVKRRINELAGSTIVEEKSYRPY